MRKVFKNLKIIMCIGQFPTKAEHLKQIRQVKAIK